MSISSKLDLISEEIGGTLDGNSSIEKQVNEIYEIIKSGKWPVSSGGSGVKFIKNNYTTISEHSGTAEKDGYLNVSVYTSASSDEMFSITIDDVVVYNVLIPGMSSDIYISTFPIKKGQSWEVTTDYGALNPTVRLYDME